MIIDQKGGRKNTTSRNVLPINGLSQNWIVGSCSSGGWGWVAY